MQVHRYRRESFLVQCCLHSRPSQRNFSHNSNYSIVRVKHYVSNIFTLNKQILSRFTLFCLFSNQADFKLRFKLSSNFMPISVQLLPFQVTMAHFIHLLLSSVLIGLVLCSNQDTLSLLLRKQALKHELCTNSKLTDRDIGDFEECESSYHPEVRTQSPTKMYTVNTLLYLTIEQNQTKVLATYTGVTGRPERSPLRSAFVRFERHAKG